jgi:hypothetical protein
MADGKQSGWAGGVGTRQTEPGMPSTSVAQSQLARRGAAKTIGFIGVGKVWRSGTPGIGFSDTGTDWGETTPLCPEPAGRQGMVGQKPLKLVRVRHKAVHCKRPGAFRQAE